MPRIRYRKYNPQAEARWLIAQSLEVLEDFMAQGFNLTLRQLYYQLVAQDLIANNQKSYDRLGDVISRAREAGMVDWNHIEDRTRTPQSHPHWRDASHFLRQAAPQFKLDLWDGQPVRVLVFVEKQALEEVIQQAASPLDCTYFANKGYLSSSSAWQVAHDIILKTNTHAKLDAEEGRGTAIDRWVILHLGDHDPSGLDMTRDIQERLDLYSSGYTEELEDGGINEWHTPVINVERIALNMDQIEEFAPPPNPAKQTDSRYPDYVRETGCTDSWELDAIKPAVLVQLIQDSINEVLEDEGDPELFSKRKKLQGQIIKKLKAIKI